MTGSWCGSSPACGITGLVQQFFRAKEHSLVNAELSRGPGLFCIPSPWAVPPGCPSAWPKCSHHGRSSFTGRESTTVFCHLCLMISYQRGEGMQSSRTDLWPFICGAAPNLHFLLCQTQVSLRHCRVWTQLSWSLSRGSAAPLAFRELFWICAGVGEREHQS